MHLSCSFNDVVSVHHVSSMCHKCINYEIWHLFFSATAGLNEDQKQIHEMALQFAKNEMLPKMAQWDQNVSFLTLNMQGLGYSGLTRSIS